MGDTEQKLAEWAHRRGINWALARSEITEACIPEYARFLRYAKTHNAPEEARCVELCLQLAERRARKRIEESDARIAALTADMAVTA